MMNLVLNLSVLASCLLVSDALRILTVMSVNIKSHHIWFSTLPVALAEKGHEVHSIDFHMPKKVPQTLAVDLLAQPASAQTDMAHIVGILQSGTPYQKYHAYATMSVKTCEQVLTDKAVQKLISPQSNRTFDVIILDYPWHECVFGLIHRFNYPPTILASPFPLPVPLMRVLRNPIFHALPHFFETSAAPMSFYGRLVAMAMYLYDDYVYYNYQEPDMEALIKKTFGEDCPPIRELVQHVALGLVNMVDFKPRPPLVANILSVGGMHIPPVEPLSEDLEDFLNGAKDGAIMMSFGSVVSGSNTGADKVEAILKVFSKLPQRVVWKYKSAGDEKLANVPLNVKLLSWLPQNDLLAHRNMRLFISHCGGLSSQEAAYHGVPVLGMPFITDQFANVEQVVACGMGLKLRLEDLTEESFYNNVTELLNNTKYHEAAQRAKSIMRDQLVSPLDRAVFYVEYVGRHRGAPHLRSPVADSYFESATIIVDIVFVALAPPLTVGIIFLLIIKITRFCRKERVPDDETDSKKDD